MASLARTPIGVISEVSGFLSPFPRPLDQEDRDSGSPHARRGRWWITDFTDFTDFMVIPPQAFEPPLCGHGGRDHGAHR